MAAISPEQANAFSPAPLFDPTGRLKGLDADHRRLAHRQRRCDPRPLYIQGEESLAIQRHRRGIGSDVAVAAGSAAEQCPIKSGGADDATLVISSAETVVIVPG